MDSRKCSLTLAFVLEYFHYRYDLFNLVRTCFLLASKSESKAIYILFYVILSYKIGYYDTYEIKYHPG